MHPRCSRGLVVDDMEEMITSEEIKPGVFPDWLFDQMIAQCRDPRPHSLGGPARILIIYPTNESRKESLERLADQNLVIDRTLHHTIDSLELSLLEDLRLPRVLSTSGAFSVVLNQACAEAASQLKFPILNPIESFEWNSNRTNELNQLHSLLSKENRLKQFEGPGIEAFSRVLKNLEDKLGGTHPNFVTSKIIKKLRNSIEPPFSISDIDGIIMLDHAPVLSRSKHNLLKSISLHRPIHQLEYPGNFRLGYHGEQIIDQQLIRSAKDLPNWVPNHKVFSINENNDSQIIENILRIQRESHTIPTVINLLEELLSKNPDTRILIVDPALEDNQYSWKRSLSNLAIEFSTSDMMISSLPLGHWISAAARISHGPNSFALDNLRSLSIQKSITLFEEPIDHPTDSQIVPKADSDILTSIARNEHILAGPGSLSRWLESLKREPNNPHINPKSKESSQWFLLCLAYSNRPLLDPHDRLVIDDDDMWIGCHSGEILPRPKTVITGDDWLDAIVKRANTDHTGFEDFSPLPATVIQTLVETHKRLRLIQHTSGYQPVKEGSGWVEEFQALISSTPLPSNRKNITSNVRLLSPKNALGCTADIVIMAHMSSLSWNLSLPRYAFLGDEDRHELDILRPDTPIRQARHYFYHLQSACQELFVLDPSLDNATPVSAVIGEWINSLDSENQIKELESSSHTFSDPRLHRRRDGEKLVDMQSPSRPPLNPNAVSIPIDVLVQRDIERRRPEEIDEEGYLKEDSKFMISGLLKDELLRKIVKGKPSPRSAQKWPVIGGYVSSNRATPTIDPRPFIPLETKSNSFDSRNGRTKEAKQEFQTWSPSRIKEWQICPRRGWLKYGLKAKEDELQEEDIDPRTHGDLLHNVHHGLLSEVLGMEEGKERTLSEIISGDNPFNLSHSEKSDSELQAIALDELNRLAPWLDRTDAVSTSRLRMLTGMNRVQWNKWLIDQSPSIPSGRVGTIVKAERLLQHSIPIAYEWKAKEYDNKGILISVPHEISSISGIKPIRLVGDIDRVDLLPFSDDMNDLVDESGDKSVAPLRIKGTSWKPRRLVVIRDLKTTESKSGSDRHAIGILDEVQVALYARAWEEAHPGDLVVAAGISAIGHETDHILEISKYAPKYSFGVGQKSDLTSTRFRFPDEDSKTSSDPFRAWLTHRLSTALGVATNAMQGSVNPTPSKEACRWCSVKSLCPVEFEEGDS